MKIMQKSQLNAQKGFKMPFLSSACSVSQELSDVVGNLVSFGIHNMELSGNISSMEIVLICYKRGYLSAYNSYANI